MRRLVSLLAAMAIGMPMAGAVELGALPVTAAQDDAEGGELDATDIERVAHFPYGDPSMPGTGSFFASGTDLAFDGDYVYAAEQDRDGEGGVHIIDVSHPDEPQKVGFVNCPGYQNDVAVVAEGIIALGYHSLNDAAGAPDSDCPDAVPGGVTLFDVSNPAAPFQLGTTPQLPGGTHTLTTSPDGSYIYASPGGIANGGGVQQIIDVSVRDEEVYPVHTFKPNETGCHDFAFFTSVDEREMGVCVGLAESQIWDVVDPTAPVIVARIANPLMQFMHSAVITDDGRYLVIGDEAIGANDCLGGPTGAMYAYDISTPEMPMPLSYFGINRASGDVPVNSSTAGLPGTGRDGWCTAHIYDFIPGTHIMVSSWYSGGVNIIDWGDDFTSPREVAHYRTDGEYAESEVTNYWSAYWHQGRIYANDRVRGLDALRWTAWEDEESEERKERGRDNGKDKGKDGDRPPPERDRRPENRDAEALTAAVRTMPSTDAATWRAGRFSDVLTPDQQASVDARAAINLRDGLAPFACRLVLLDD